MRTDPGYVARVRDKYNAIEDVWRDADPWHAWSRSRIKAELALVAAEFERRLGGAGLVIDVGSAGDPYLRAGIETVDVDVAERGLRGRPLPVCCNAETLALRTGIADLIVCVGPVVNYCSLEEVVDEAARISRPQADYVLHVELSNSFEFAGQHGWRSDVAFVRSFYRGEENYWVYSDAFARRILAQAGYKVRRVRYFHFASSLAYRVTGDVRLASRFAGLDRVLSRLPGCGSLADSAIYVCCRET